MSVFAGVDEAGLGPLLGPLTIGYSVLRTPGQRTRSARDPWRRLWRVVAEDPDDDEERFVVADSKVVFTRNDRGSRRLEATALGFLGVAADRDGAPRTGRALLSSAPPPALPSRSALARHPWYARLPRRLPLFCERDELERRTQELARELERRETRVESAGVRVVPTGELNASFERTDSKNLTLWNLTADLLEWMWESWGGEGLDVLLDRHGGRLHYEALLESTFPWCRVRTLEESAEICRYEVTQGSWGTGAGRRMAITVRPKGEQHSFAAALGSCLAKYARETCMEAFNDYFGALQPGLKPTAGYRNDGWRWLEDAAPALEKAPVDESLLVRAR